jgi:hypothetical protein
MEGGAVGHNIERGPSKEHPSQICFNLVLGQSHFNIVSDSSTIHSKWLLLLKLEISLVVNFRLITNQNELKF